MLDADDRATISDDDDLTFITTAAVTEEDREDDDLYDDERTYRGPAANGECYPDDAPTWPNYEPYDRARRGGSDFEDETTERLRLAIDLNALR